MAYEDAATRKKYTPSLHIGVGVAQRGAAACSPPSTSAASTRAGSSSPGRPWCRSTRRAAAASGEVCCSAEALIEGQSSGHPPKDDPGGFVLVDEIRDAAAAAIVLPALECKRDHAALMKRYVPDTVAPKLEAGIDTHIAELHMVSVLFINCHGVHLAATPDYPLATVSQDGKRLMRMVQKCVNQHEGSVNKMLVDDKGTLIICALGLPPRPHADDPVRAVARAPARQGLRPPPLLHVRRLPAAPPSAARPTTTTPTATPPPRASRSSRRARRTRRPRPRPRRARARGRARRARRAPPAGAAAASATAASATPGGWGLRSAQDLEPVTTLLGGGGGGRASKGADGGRGGSAAAAAVAAVAADAGAAAASDNAAAATAGRPRRGAAPAKEEASAARGGGRSRRVRKAPPPPLEGVVVLDRHRIGARLLRRGRLPGRPQQYTLMGDTVNLSARLMGHASQHGLGILVDSTTFRHTDTKAAAAAVQAGDAGETVEYRTLEPVKLKGKASLIPIFQPQRLVKSAKGKKKEMEVLEFGGRAPELARLRKMFAMLHTYGSGGTMILLGERGSGKKNIVKELEKMGAAACMAVIVGSEDMGKVSFDTAEAPATTSTRSATSWSARRCTPRGTRLPAGGRHARGARGGGGRRRRRRRRPLQDGRGARRAEGARGAARRARRAPPVRAELSAVGKLVLHCPPSYTPPPATRRGQIVADLAVCLLIEAAKHADLLLILHLITRTSADASLNFDAWKIANAAARATCKRSPSERTMLLTIVSRASMFKETIADVEEIVGLAKQPLDPLVAFEDDNRILSLDPYDEPRRAAYLYEVLKKMFCPELAEISPADLPADLVTYVSETAGGVPLQIREVTEALVKQKAISFAPKASGAGKVRCVPLAELLGDARYKVPSKVAAASMRIFEALSERHQLIVKLLSPLPPSRYAVLRLLVDNIPWGVAAEGREEAGADELANKMCQEELLDLARRRASSRRSRPPTPSSAGTTRRPRRATSSPTSSCSGRSPRCSSTPTAARWPPTWTRWRPP